MLEGPDTTTYSGDKQEFIENIRKGSHAISKIFIENITMLKPSRHTPKHLTFFIITAYCSNTALWSSYPRGR